MEEEAETIESSTRMTRKQTSASPPPPPDGDDQQESIADIGSSDGEREDLASSKSLEVTKESSILASPPDFNTTTECWAGSRSGETPPQLFPMTLHEMLEEAEREHKDHIVGWDPDGLSFKIHKPNEFAKTIMPRYFKNQSKFRSFQRQVRQDEELSNRSSFLLLLLLLFRLLDRLNSLFRILVGRRYTVISIPILESTSWSGKRRVHPP